MFLMFGFRSWVVVGWKTMLTLLISVFLFSFFFLLVPFTDPLRQSLSDGRTDRSKWPAWPHDGRRTMSALPAVQHCKLRKPGGIPPLKNGEDGVEVFLKSIMEPACR